MRPPWGRSGAAVLFVLALLICPAAAGLVTVEVPGPVTASDVATISSNETQIGGRDSSGGIATPDQYGVIVPLYGAFEVGALRSAARPFLEPPAYCVDAETTDRSVFPTLPAPGALILAAIGLLCLGWFRRRHTTGHGVE